MNSQFFYYRDNKFGRHFLAVRSSKLSFARHVFSPAEAETRSEGWLRRRYQLLNLRFLLWAAHHIGFIREADPFDAAVVHQRLTSLALSTVLALVFDLALFRWAQHLTHARLVSTYLPFSAVDALVKHRGKIAPLALLPLSCLLLRAAAGNRFLLDTALKYRPFCDPGLPCHYSDQTLLRVWATHSPLIARHGLSLPNSG